MIHTPDVHFPRLITATLTCERRGLPVFDEAAAELCRRHRLLVAVVKRGEGDPTRAAAGGTLDAHKLISRRRRLLLRPDQDGVPRDCVWPPLVEGKLLDHLWVHHVAEAYSVGGIIGMCEERSMSAVERCGSLLCIALLTKGLSINCAEPCLHIFFMLVIHPIYTSTFMVLFRLQNALIT